MPLDPSAVGLEGTPTERSWTAKDTMLYALGVGCGVDQLSFSTEKNQQVLPTYAVIAGMGGIPFDKIGTFNFAMLVHGEQAIEVFGAIPPAGKVRTTGRVAAIVDKGKAGLVTFECESKDAETGELRFRNRMTAFIRGAGGFGGDPGPKAVPFEVPGRKADHEVTYQTTPDQALIYRLSGDMNPLHSDPDLAKSVGFPKPILHGLCTFGHVGRAILHTFCDGDPARMKDFDVRFSGVVYPGETIVSEMWKEGADRVVVQAKTKERGEVVLSNAAATIG